MAVTARVERIVKNFTARLETNMIACVGELMMLSIDGNGSWGSSIEFHLIEIIIYVNMNHGRDPMHTIPFDDYPR